MEVIRGSLGKTHSCLPVNIAAKLRTASRAEGISTILREHSGMISKLAIHPLYTNSDDIANFETMNAREKWGIKYMKSSKFAAYERDLVALFCNPGSYANTLFVMSGNHELEITRQVFKANGSSFSSKADIIYSASGRLLDIAGNVLPEFRAQIEAFFARRGLKIVFAFGLFDGACLEEGMGDARKILDSLGRHQVHMAKNSLLAKKAEDFV